MPATLAAWSWVKPSVRVDANRVHTEPVEQDRLAAPESQPLRRSREDVAPGDLRALAL